MFVLLSVMHTFIKHEEQCDCDGKDRYYESESEGERQCEIKHMETQSA